MDNHPVKHYWKQKKAWEIEESSNVEEQKTKIHRIAADSVNALGPQLVVFGW